MEGTGGPLTRWYWCSYTLSSFVGKKRYILLCSCLEMSEEYSKSTVSQGRAVRYFELGVNGLRVVNMFRRQINNSRRWISYYSRPRKSSTVFIRGVAVATSVAAAAVAVANQQFAGGPIHNDAVPSTAAPRSNQAASREDDGGEGLRLLVWGSNRFVLRYCPPPSL